jgi:hypothetical protein
VTISKSCSQDATWTRSVEISEKRLRSFHAPKMERQTQSNTTKLNVPYPSPKQCRYWEGDVDERTYRLTTCAYCYKYLFMTGTELMPYDTFLVSINGTIFPHGTFVTPDISNQTIIDMVCQTLETSTSCSQWLACCQAAEQCCASQLDDVSSAVIGEEGSRGCPSTWDGYACWGRMKAGESVQASCPGYIPHALPSGRLWLLVI